MIDALRSFAEMELVGLSLSGMLKGLLDDAGWSFAGMTPALENLEADAAGSTLLSLFLSPVQALS